MVVGKVLSVPLGLDLLVEEMLARERTFVIEKFEELAKQDPRVQSAFLGGSLADGTADELSDIDVYYLVDEYSYSGFHSDVQEWLKTLGPLVFFDEHSNFGFDLMIFVYRSGVKGELGLGTTKNMKQMHAGPYKVLVDKKHLLDGVVFEFQGGVKGDELRRYVEKQLNWYWYWYNVFLTSISRKRLWSALSHLEFMRDHMFRLLVMAYNPDKFPDRVERRVPEQVRDEIGKASLPQYETRSLLDCAYAMTMIMKREVQPLVDLTRAVYPFELEKVVLDKREQVIG